MASVLCQFARDTQQSQSVNMAALFGICCVELFFWLEKLFSCPTIRVWHQKCLFISVFLYLPGKNRWIQATILFNQVTLITRFYFGNRKFSFSVLLYYAQSVGRFLTHFQIRVISCVIAHSCMIADICVIAHICVMIAHSCVRIAQIWWPWLSDYA